MSAIYDKIGSTLFGYADEDEYARRAGQRADLKNAPQNDYNQNLLNNRPDQQTAFGSMKWTTGPDGRPMQTASLNPEDQQRLGQQRGFMSGQLGLAGDAMARARGAGGLNLNGSSMLGSGQQYNQQAEDAIFGRASARLDPMWARREEGQRTQLLNQGLDPSSEAYKNQMSDLGMQRNDAYSSAMNDAIRAGGDRGAQLFGMDLSRAGLSNNEATQMHNSNYQDMAGALGGYQPISGMPQMPGFANVGGPNTLGGQVAASNAQNAWNSGDDSRMASRIGAITSLGGAAIGSGLFGGGGSPAAASGSPYYLQNGADEQFAGTPYASSANTYPKQPWESGYQAFPQY